MSEEDLKAKFLPKENARSKAGRELCEHYFPGFRPFMRILSVLVASVKMNGHRQSSRHQVVMEQGKFVPMNTTPQNVEVIVIGAGIAGLAAARDLSIDGYDVLVLEARDRIGGRIWTSHDLGLPTDLGASWIHGFEDNPISRLAKRHGIEILRTDISSVSPARYRSVALYEEDGRRLSRRETVEMSEMMADYLDFIALKQKRP